jgi:hypothetical protein
MTIRASSVPLLLHCSASHGLHRDDLNLENPLHATGDNRPDDPYLCWWDCPIHGGIEDGEEERDSDGDPVCPVPTGPGLICGKPLDFCEDDGEPTEEDFDD